MMRGVLAPMDRAASTNSRVLEADDLAADYAGDRQPGDQGYGDEEDHDAASSLVAGYGHDDDHDQHVRQAVHDVDEAHEEVVQSAAHVAGDGSDQDADEDGRQGADDADHDGYAAAVDGARQHVAPQVVRAQDVDPAVHGVGVDGLAEGFDLHLGCSNSSVTESRK